MERQHALIVLGAGAADDDEQLRECLEEAVFSLANYFMRREFIPALSVAKRKKLEKLIEAANVLGIDTSENNVDDAYLPMYKASNMSDIKVISLSSILEAYHQREAQLKHRLANALSPRLAAQIYAMWESLYLDFASSFCTQYEKQYGGRKIDNDVKLSENFDYNLLKVELLDSNSEAHQLHRYYSRLRKIIGET